MLSKHNMFWTSSSENQPKAEVAFRVDAFNASLSCTLWGLFQPGNGRNPFEPAASVIHAGCGDASSIPYQQARGRKHDNFSTSEQHASCRAQPMHLRRWCFAKQLRKSSLYSCKWTSWTDVHMDGHDSFIVVIRA